MDDVKIWFYLIVGGIYLLSRILKKSGSQEEDDSPSEIPGKDSRQPSTQQPSGGRPKQLTFEELLREISESKSPAKPTITPPVSSRNQPAPRPAYVDYDDDLEEEAKGLEKVPDFRDSDSYRIYEQAKQEAFNRPSMENLTPRRADVQYEKFKAFETERKETVLQSYVAGLRDPEGFKKAFIMGEILNRKHF